MIDDKWKIKKWEIGGLLQNHQLQLGDLSFLPTDITAPSLRRFLAPLPRRHSRREWRRWRREDQTEQSSPTTRRLNLTIPQLKLGVFARGSRKWKMSHSYLAPPSCAKI